MEKLKGKTILIGRGEGNSRLMITVSDGKVRKSVYMGQPGTVPNTVSRCIPAQNIAHCSIAIDHNGTMTLSNLKAKNVTYVDGTAVATKHISTGSRVELGSQKYSISIDTILKAAEKIMAAPTTPQPNAPQQQQAYSIGHLEKVWNDYQKGLEELQNEQYKVNMMSRVPMAFTFGAGAITALANSFDWPTSVQYFTLALTIIGFAALVYGLYMSMKFHNGTEKRRQLTDDFMRDYNCPNCGNYLGNTQFFIIKKRGVCPFCRCKFK